MAAAALRDNVVRTAAGAAASDVRRLSPRRGRPACRTLERPDEPEPLSSSELPLEQPRPASLVVTPEPATSSEPGVTSKWSLSPDRLPANHRRAPNPCVRLPLRSLCCGRSGLLRPIRVVACGTARFVGAGGATGRRSSHPVGATCWTSSALCCRRRAVGRHHRGSTKPEPGSPRLVLGALSSCRALLRECLRCTDLVGAGTSSETTRPKLLVAWRSTEPPSRVVAGSVVADQIRVVAGSQGNPVGRVWGAKRARPA